MLKRIFTETAGSVASEISFGAMVIGILVIGGLFAVAQIEGVSFSVLLHQIQNGQGTPRPAACGSLIRIGGTRLGCVRDFSPPSWFPAPIPGTGNCLVRARGRVTGRGPRDPLPDRRGDQRPAAQRRDAARGLYELAGLIVLAGAVKGVLTYFRRQLAGRLSLAVEYDLRNAMYGHLQRLSYSFFDRHQTGQLMSRATVDLQLVRIFLGYGLIFFTQNFMTVVVVVIAARADRLAARAGRDSPSRPSWRTPPTATRAAPSRW